MKVTSALEKISVFLWGRLVEAQLKWLARKMVIEQVEIDLLFRASGKCGSTLKVYEIRDGFMF